MLIIDAAIYMLRWGSDHLLPLAMNSNALYIKRAMNSNALYIKRIKVTTNAAKKTKNSLLMSIRSSKIKTVGCIFSILLKSAVICQA
jgi:hypothetical protein